MREALADAEYVELAAEELEKQLEKMRSLEAEAQRLRKENDSLRLRGDGLESDNETLQERLAAAYAITRELPKEDQPVSQPDIGSTSDAVAEADGRFAHLRFSAESHRSADQSLFQRPLEVYRALQVLDQLGAEMAEREGDLGDTLHNRFRNEGFDYAAQESTTTMAQWAAERRATHGERNYEMERHLRWGGASRQSQLHLRLYFEWERDGPYWVIGHVGDHLTNTKS